MSKYHNHDKCINDYQLSQHPKIDKISFLLIRLIGK